MPDRLLTTQRVIASIIRQIKEQKSKRSHESCYAAISLRLKQVTETVIPEAALREWLNVAYSDPVGFCDRLERKVPLDETGFSELVAATVINRAMLYEPGELPPLLIPSFAEV